MLQLHDYIAALAELRRRGRRVGLVIFGCFLAWFAIMSLGSVWFKGPGQDNWIVLGASFVPLLAGVAITAWLLRRDARMVCPHCRHSQQRMGAWTIATRNCGNCGRRMFDEPAPTASDTSLLSEEEIRAPAHVEIRRELTWIIVAMVTAIGLFAAAAALIAWLRTRWSDGTAEWLPFAIVGPTLLILEYAIWLRWGSRKIDRSLRCPHCAEALVEVCGVVLATGNCGHCGRRVFSQPPAPVADSAPIAVEEFRRLSSRWAIKLIALGVGGMVVVLGGLLLGGWIAAWFPGGERRPPEGIALAVMLVTPVASCVVYVVLIALFMGRRDPRLNCPNCKRDLMGKHVEIIIATGRCPQCRRQLLEASALPVR